MSLLRCISFEILSNSSCSKSNSLSLPPSPSCSSAMFDATVIMYRAIEISWIDAKDALVFGNHLTDCPSEDAGVLTHKYSWYCNIRKRQCEELKRQREELGNLRGLLQICTGLVSGNRGLQVYVFKTTRRGWLAARIRIHSSIPTMPLSCISTTPLPFVNLKTDLSEEIPMKAPAQPQVCTTVWGNVPVFSENRIQPKQNMGLLIWYIRFRWYQRA